MQNVVAQPLPTPPRPTPVRFLLRSASSKTWSWQLVPPSVETIRDLFTPILKELNLPMTEDVELLLHGIPVSLSQHVSLIRDGDRIVVNVRHQKFRLSAGEFRFTVKQSAVLKKEETTRCEKQNRMTVSQPTSSSPAKLKWNLPVPDEDVNVDKLPDDGKPLNRRKKRVLEEDGTVQDRESLGTENASPSTFGKDSQLPNVHDKEPPKKKQKRILSATGKQRRNARNRRREKRRRMESRAKSCVVNDRETLKSNALQETAAPLLSGSAVDKAQSEGKCLQERTEPHSAPEQHVLPSPNTLVGAGHKQERADKSVPPDVTAQAEKVQTPSQKLQEAKAIAVAELQAHNCVAVSSRDEEPAAEVENKKAGMKDVASKNSEPMESTKQTIPGPKEKRRNIQGSMAVALRIARENGALSGNFAKSTSKRARSFLQESQTNESIFVGFDSGADIPLPPLKLLDLFENARSDVATTGKDRNSEQEGFRRDPVEELGPGDRSDHPLQNASAQQDKVLRPDGGRVPPGPSHATEETRGGLLRGTPGNGNPLVEAKNSVRVTRSYAEGMKLPDKSLSGRAAPTSDAAESQDYHMPSSSNVTCTITGDVGSKSGCVSAGMKELQTPRTQLRDEERDSSPERMKVPFADAFRNQAQAALGGIGEDGKISRTCLLEDAFRETEQKQRASDSPAFGSNECEAGNAHADESKGNAPSSCNHGDTKGRCGSATGESSQEKVGYLLRDSVSIGPVTCNPSGREVRTEAEIKRGRKKSVPRSIEKLRKKTSELHKHYNRFDGLEHNVDLGTIATKRKEMGLARPLLLNTMEVSGAPTDQARPDDSNLTQDKSATRRTLPTKPQATESPSTPKCTWGAELNNKQKDIDKPVLFKRSRSMNGIAHGKHRSPSSHTKSAPHACSFLANGESPSRTALGDGMRPHHRDKARDKPSLCSEPENKRNESPGGCGRRNADKNPSASDERLSVLQCSNTHRKPVGKHSSENVVGHLPIQHPTPQLSSQADLTSSPSKHLSTLSSRMHATNHSRPGTRKTITAITSEQLQPQIKPQDTGRFRKIVRPPGASDNTNGAGRRGSSVSAIANPMQLNPRSFHTSTTVQPQPETNSGEFRSELIEIVAETASLLDHVCTKLNQQ